MFWQLIFNNFFLRKICSYYSINIGQCFNIKNLRTHFRELFIVYFLVITKASLYDNYDVKQELPVHQRADAVSSLVYEANARVRDPVYGCVGAISFLQNQVSQLQMQLAVAQAEILCTQMQQEPVMPTPQMDPDDKSSYLFHDSLPQYLNFSSSSNVIHDSFKRESIFGHDMVS